MAAANTDKFRKKKNLFSTTLNGGIAADATSLTCNSLSGVPTDTAVTITIDRVDANGVSTPAYREDVTGVVSGSNVTNLVRGEGATTAQVHASGAVVELTWETETWNDAVDGILAGHNQDGSHKSGMVLTAPQINDTTADHQYIIAVSELEADRTVTLPLLTGNDDFVFEDHAQTLTNKTLTSPKINEDVALTATATELNLLDGIVGLNKMPINAPEGFLINGKIVPSVASNNLTVALKGLDGNDPSASNPLYVRIGDTVRSITSALSVTKNAGTNWFNAGSAELATKEIDYFVYLGYNATDGVVIGFSRIPYATQYDQFSATTTNEKYCAISTITTADAGDDYTVVGRFAATLSAGAGYTWTVPTFTSINLKQRPIFNTRWLVYANSFFGSGGSIGTYAIDTSSFRYMVDAERCFVKITARVTNKGSWSGDVLSKLPIYPTTLGSEGDAYIFGGVVANNTNPIATSKGGWKTTTTNATCVSASYNAALQWSAVANNDTFFINGVYEI